MPTLAQLARARLDSLRAARVATAVKLQEEKLAAAGTPVDPLSGLGLMDFVPALEPKYTRPLHFKALVEDLERAQAGEPIRDVVHGPPQHGKTSLLQDFFVWGLRKNPSLTYGYASFGAALSKSKSRKTRDLAISAGVKLSAKAVGEWRTTEGGGLIATGVGGPLVGNRVDIMVIDDPYKNRQEALSPARRLMIREWFADIVNARMHPTGSIFCFGTRWDPEDLGGFLIKEYGFKYLRFPAINDAGEALAPHLHPANSLKFNHAKRNAYSWASIYQGDPRPRGKTVFEPPSIYDKLPNVFQHAFGVDGAYSEKTAADYSAVVRLLRARVPGDTLPHFFVAYAARDQVRLPVFRLELAKLHALYPGAVGWRWYVATTEQGGADTISDRIALPNGESMPGAPVHGVPARGDKYARALAVSEAWNDGRVHVPKDAPWLEDFLAEVINFTGINDPHDDFVDALAAAFDLLNYADDGEAVSPLVPLRPTGLGATGM